MADKSEGGLWSAIAGMGLIRPDRWDHAAATGEVIGICSACGGYLVPDDLGWPEYSTIEWFNARCLDCGKECAAPNGHLLKHRERGGYGWR